MSRLVPVRVWSCPVHDYDTACPGDPYDGFSDPWGTEGEVCLDCVTGHWVAKKDANGVVEMRELGAFEEMLLEGAAQAFNYPPLLLRALNGEFARSKITWLEDESMPKVAL